MTIDFSKWRASDAAGGIVDENGVRRVTCRHAVAVPLLAAAQDGQRLSEATRNLLAAAKEASNALAAACRSIVRTGVPDDFLRECQQCSIRDGVGVRLQDAIAAVETTMNDRSLLKGD